MVPRPTPSPEPAETFPLAIGHSLIDVPRLWTGLWQLSSPAWGTAPAARIRKEMLKHVSKGFTAFGTYRAHVELPCHFLISSRHPPRPTPHAAPLPYVVLDHRHHHHPPSSPAPCYGCIPQLTITPLDMVCFFLVLRVPFLYIYICQHIYKLPKTDVGYHLLSRPRLSRVSCVR